MSTWVAARSCSIARAPRRPQPDHGLRRRNVVIFGHDEWSQVSCALKTLADAVDLRQRIFDAFEEAERAEDPAARQEWLTFVVVGGGPTGVEISGQLAILARQAMKNQFRRVDTRAARVILLDAGDRVVPAFSEPTSAKAAKEIQSLGITVREHALVTGIDPRGVTVKIGDRTERIASRTGALGSRGAACTRGGRARARRGCQQPIARGISRSTRI